MINRSHIELAVVPEYLIQYIDPNDLTPQALLNPVHHDHIPRLPIWMLIPDDSRARGVAG